MVKFARQDAKPFNPLSRKLIDEAGGQGQQQDQSREGQEPKVIHMPTGIEERSRQETGTGSTPEIETKEDRLTESMRYRVSRVERREIERFVGRISDAASMTLTHSNVIRACRDILFQVEDRIADELRRAKLKRPINDRRALTLFETHLAEIIHTAIRQSPLPYSRGSGE